MTTPSEPSLIAFTEGLWVLDKPAGWVVHPTNDPKMNDVIAWSRKRLGVSEYFAPIHRIDRQTSGLVLYSSDADLRAEIGRYFADNEVEKTYQALVYGTPPARATIDSPLDDGRRGKPLDASTHYDVLEAFPSCALLAVRPKTGRKHQIRRHLEGIGHAVVGDTRYVPRQRPNIAGFPRRMWLHAFELRLPDGRSFQAPLPPELEDHLELLRSLIE